MIKKSNKKMMKDIEFKAVSFGLTGVSVLSFYNLVSDNSSLLGQSLAVIGGVAVSYVWSKKVISPLIDANKKGLVFLFSMPFVTSWVLITPTIYNKYMNIYHNKNYTLYKERVITLEKTVKNSSAIGLEIVKNKQNIKIDTSKLDNLRISKSSIISQIEGEVKEKRMIWKESKHKKETEYQSYIDSYIGNIGSGLVAVHNISVMLYNQMLNTEKEKIQAKKDSLIKKSGVGELEIAKKSNDIKVKELGSLKENIKKIEQSDSIGITVFYLFVAMFGVFMETFLTHISFWLSGQKTVEVTKREGLEDIVLTPNSFLRFVGADKPNYRLNAMYAVLACYVSGEKMTQKNIELFSAFTNPKTNRLYKTGKVGLEARRFLMSFEQTQLLENHKIDFNVLKKVVIEYVHYNK